MDNLTIKIHLNPKNSFDSEIILLLKDLKNQGTFIKKILYDHIREPTKNVEKNVETLSELNKKNDSNDDEFSKKLKKLIS